MLRHLEVQSRSDVPAISQYLLIFVGWVSVQADHNAINTIKVAGRSPEAQPMDERVRRLKSPRDCQIFAKNAGDRNRPDLAHQACRRAIDLRMQEHETDDPMTRAWYEALYAQEEALAHRDGKPARAGSNRVFLKKYGAQGAIERSLAVKGDSAAYETLKGSELQDLSFENTVLRFPEQFSQQVVERARANLASWA